MGLKRRVRTTAKRMGLRIGAARRIPTSTTTVAASISMTRKKEIWRSASVMPWAILVLSVAVLSAASSML